MSKPAECLDAYCNMLFNLEGRKNNCSARVMVIDDPKGRDLIMKVCTRDDCQLRKDLSLLPEVVVTDGFGGRKDAHRIAVCYWGHTEKAFNMGRKYMTVADEDGYGNLRLVRLGTTTERAREVIRTEGWAALSRYKIPQEIKDYLRKELDGGYTRKKCYVSGEDEVLLSNEGGGKWECMNRHCDLCYRSAENGAKRIARFGTGDLTVAEPNGDGVIDCEEVRRRVRYGGYTPGGSNIYRIGSW